MHTTAQTQHASQSTPDSPAARPEKTVVCILFGGVSSEHTISLKSADTVVAALDRTRYEPVLVGIARNGAWLRYRGDSARIVDGSWEDGPCTPAFIAPDRQVHGLVELADDGTWTTTRIDVALPVLHGRGGEDGSIQGLFELAGIAYVGCGILASALGMDKATTYGIVAEAGVRCPRCHTLAGNFGDADALRIAEKLGYPLFVKPANGGSSFGVSKVETAAQLARAVQVARDYDAKVCFEEAIEGTEVGCAIMGNPGDADGLVCGLPDQITVQSGLFRIHQEAKPGSNAENSTIVCPADLPDAVVSYVQETGKRIYAALGCEGLTRVDMFLTPGGELVFNEVNTFPGMTYYSRFPAMMRAAGHGMPEVLDHVINLALKRG